MNKKLAIQVLNICLSTGADFAEIFEEDTSFKSVSIENYKVDSCTTNRCKGIGIRVLKNFQSVYGVINNFNAKELIDLATKLSASFSGKQEVFVTNLKVKKHNEICPVNDSIVDTKNSEIIEYLRTPEEVLKTEDSRLVKSSIGLVGKKRSICIYNSKGFIHKDVHNQGRVFINTVLAENGQIQVGYEAPGGAQGFGWFKQQIDLKKLAKKCISYASTMFKAKDCPSGKMMVVIGNGFGGVIFHESCGHSLEATSVTKKLSVFSDSKGTQIASPIVTAIDDGTILNAWGSNTIDDEGNKTQKNILIKDGILNSYLIDDFNGRRMNTVGNGTCRRQSYKFEPTSRMSNTYIANGTSTPEEIISSVKLGLYAKSMGGGSVNPATGEFNFAVKEAYIIRDGKICEPVKGATLIGSGSEILKNIDMIANDLDRAQGMCGSVSGSIPTDVGQPTIRVSEILVGGNGGELR